jgi:hypothetical protein
MEGNMEREYRISWCWIACLYFALLPFHALAQQSVERIVIFGDSLSDPGNANHLFGIRAERPHNKKHPEGAFCSA